jgi:oxygen-independent coproporphyrinogen-3 oxidase
VCDYCDFYSLPLEAGDSRPEAYVDRLLSDGEALLSGFGVEKIPTVYIGGGTPSVLGAAAMGRLLEGLSGLFSGFSEKISEFTVEANPESADESFLEACIKGGVKRLSLGVQSFHEPSRLAVRRVGAASLLRPRLALARDMFGSSFSADLIAGLPHQTEKILLNDIEKLLAYGPGHVSLYSLTVEAGTPLEKSAVSKDFPLPDHDEADRLWLAGRDFLEKAGYEQYEVSNFALNGKRSAHNIRYWRMENWLGLGPGASGTVISSGEAGETKGCRYTVIPNADTWLRRAKGEEAPEIAEVLDKLTLMKETFLMGFRYIEGPDTDLFAERFGLSIEEAIPETLAKWRGRGLLQNNRTALSSEGLLLLDPFLIDAFREAEHLTQ